MDRPGPFHPALDDGDRLRAAPGADVAPARHHVGHDVAQPTIEVAVVGAAAEFAVGDDAQSHPLLQLDRVHDGGLFGCGKRIIAKLTIVKAPTRLSEGGRPQQAADMVGTEWRMAGHGRSLRLVTRSVDSTFVPPGMPPDTIVLAKYASPRNAARARDSVRHF